MKLFKYFCLTVMFFSIFLLGSFVSAANFEKSAATKGALSQVDIIANKAELEKPIAPQSIVINIIKYALAFTGTLFLVLVVYGGFLLINAHGEDEMVEKGKKIIVGSVVGIALVLMSYSVTSFFGDRVNSLVTKDAEVQR